MLPQYDSLSSLAKKCRHAHMSIHVRTGTVCRGVDTANSRHEIDMCVRSLTWCCSVYFMWSEDASEGPCCIHGQGQLAGCRWHREPPLVIQISPLEQRVRTLLVRGATFLCSTYEVLCVALNEVQGVGREAHPEGVSDHGSWLQYKFSKERVTAILPYAL